MIRRLWVQLWLAFLGVAAGTAIAAGAVGRVVGHRDTFESGAAAIRVLASSALAGDREIDARLGDLSQRTQLDLAMWTEDGRLIARAGAEDLQSHPPDRAGDDVDWRAVRGGPTWQVHLDDGRWLVARPARPPRHGVGLAMFTATLGVTAAGCYAIARRITRRLELLESGVERFGAGELATRVPVDGDDEVARVAERFNRAASRIQALVDAQRRTLASASHELRSPLARIRMAVALLDDGGPERAALVRAAEADVEELDRLVGDLLLAGRLQAGALRQEDLDLGRLVRERAARHPGVTVEGEARIIGDRIGLTHAIDNLLENARRHAGGADRIDLANTDSMVTVSVGDRGPGIDAAIAERIFEPFFRPADHDEGRDGGVGLGLALVREVAAAHGGQARCLPRAGGGTWFYLTARVDGPG